MTYMAKLCPFFSHHNFIMVQFDTGICQTAQVENANVTSISSSSASSLMGGTGSRSQNLRWHRLTSNED